MTFWLRAMAALGPELGRPIRLEYQFWWVSDARNRTVIAQLSIP